MEKGNASLHFLDRYIGIPLVMILGLLRIRKHKIPSAFSPKRIAILNISSIGDNVLMSGPLKDLQQAYPQAEISIFCGETNHGLVKMIPNITHIVKLSVSKLGASISQIRQDGPYDLMIDFGPWPRLNSIYSAFFQAQIKIGFKSKNQARHYIYDYAVPHSDKRHELDNFRSLLTPLGIHAQSLPSLKISPKEIELPSEYILLHPWPGGYKSYMKEWPREKWLALIARISTLGLPIYITGASADIESSRALVEGSGGKAISLAGKYNLADTALVVSKAKVLITVNTGIMHLGAALGTPMVALHGPTSVKRWGPVSDRAFNIAPKGSECGYLHYGYEYNKSTLNCMDLITVEEVHKAILNHLL